MLGTHPAPTDPRWATVGGLLYWLCPLAHGVQTQSSMDPTPLGFANAQAALAWLDATQLPGWAHCAGRVWWVCYADDRGVWAYVSPEKMLQLPDW